MLRSDIMLNTSPCQKSPFCCWKQVEINTIASGFGWMGPASGILHRFVSCKNLQCEQIIIAQKAKNCPNLITLKIYLEKTCKLCCSVCLVYVVSRVPIVKCQLILQSTSSKKVYISPPGGRDRDKKTAVPSLLDFVYVFAI